MRNILITGGCGYLGSELIKILLSITDDYEIIVLDKLYFGLDSIKDILNSNRIKFYRCDIRNINKKKNLFNGINTVIHLAALSNDASGELNPDTTMDINVESTRRILDLCVNYNIKKFIFASTCSLYECTNDMADENSKVKPISTYGKSKLLAENIIKPYMQFIYDISILRFGTMFGYSKRFRTDLVVNTMIKGAITKGEIIVNGSGNQYRPLIHVKDLVNMIILLLGDYKKRCEIYNLLALNITMSGLANYIADIFNQKYNKKINIKRTLNELADKLDYNVSNEKFLNEFNYKFNYDFEYTIREIFSAYNCGEIMDFENPIYNNAVWLKHLLYMEKYIKNIKGRIL